MKIAVTGSSGWLARSLFFSIENLNLQGFDLDVNFYSRESKKVQLADGRTILTKPIEQIRNSHFDLYIPLAFLTREKYSSLGEKVYEDENRRIIQKDVYICETQEEPKVLLISSGVVKHPSALQIANPSFMSYAKLKKQQEEVFKSIIRTENLNVCYLYSCTSRDMTNIGYAFSSIVMKALNNEQIHINSYKKVLRKYVDLRQLFEVMIRSIASGNQFTISSGGELIEIQDLANLIVSELDSESIISRSEIDIGHDDDYFSKDNSMESLFSENKMNVIGIRDQIRNVSSALRSN